MRTETAATQGVAAAEQRQLLRTETAATHGAAREREPLATTTAATHNRAALQCCFTSLFLVAPSTAAVDGPLRPLALSLWGNGEAKLVSVRHAEWQGSEAGSKEA